MSRFYAIIKQLSVITIVIVLRVATATECQELLPNQTTFDVHFWELYPYTTSNLTRHSRQLQGAFNLLATNLTTNTTLKLKWGTERPYNEILELSESSSGPTNKIAIPIMIEEANADPCYVKLYESMGLAYVVRRNVKKPLQQLGGSFINGGQVIGLTLILTAIAGVCMWALDQHRNPENFPPSFILGSWQGFWWAFVTMTTVGYGDLAPKSVPARTFSILWMLLGMVAFSVLTANFTSSLAREIETDLNLFNKKIAVFKGSIERKAAINVGGKYVEYTSLSNEMLKAIKDKHVEGLLVDRHAIVSDDKIIEDTAIEIGKMIDYKHFVGMKLIMPKPEMCVAVKRCMEQMIKRKPFQETLLKSISMSTVSKEDVEQAGSLFEDYEFFIILIALFGVMVCIGVVWEYFWYRPQMMKKNKIKTEEEEMTERKGLKYIMTDTEVKNLCESCCGTVEAIYVKEGQERKERLQAESSPQSPTININNLNPFKRNKKAEKDRNENV